MSDDTSPLETALDLFVYIPVGFALTIGEEVPKLAAKGRSRLGGRIAAARMIGQFAVAQGRREVDRRLSTPTPSPAASNPAASSPAASNPAASSPAASNPAAPGRPAPATAAPTPTAGATAGTSPAGTSPAGTSPTGPTGVAPAAARAASGHPAADAPDVATLAIPGYDSLSASQVVQRLAGLSGPELEAVGRYESSTRGRRTILARVTQLQTR